jgi:hypothetical protein
MQRKLGDTLAICRPERLSDLYGGHPEPRRRNA